MISAEITVSGYILPPPELPQIRPQVEVPSDRLRILATVTKTVAEARELLQQQNDKFEGLFQLLEKRADVNADEIERIAESVIAGLQLRAPKLIVALQTMNEHVVTLRQSANPYLHGPVLRLAEEGVDIGKTWLELYQNFQISLMKLASDRRAQTEEGSPVFSDSSAAEAYLRSVLAE